MRLPAFTAASAIATLLLTAAAPFAQAADAWPTKPIRLIVPFAPGGSTDVLARLISEELRGELGQTVLVENKPGAGGNLGGDAAAKSPADGYTLLMAAAGPIVVNPSLYRKMPYDPAKDLRPVTQLIAEPSLFAINPKIPARTVGEFIAYAKSRNDVSFGSAGNGSPSHLAGIWLNQLTGTQMVHVPYKGTGPAINDAIAGQIALVFDNMPAVWPFVQSGQLRGLAVSSEKRTATAPDLPTMAEAGVKGMVFTAWKGLMVPAGTPDAVVDKLYAATQKVLAKPAFRKRLTEMGADVVGSSPAEFAAVIKSETPVWAALVKSTGTTLD